QLRLTVEARSSIDDGQARIVEARERQAVRAFSIAHGKPALEVVEGEDRVVLATRVLAVLNAVVERRRHRGDGRGGLRRLVEVEQRPSLPDPRQVQRSRGAGRTSRDDRRIELGDGGRENLLAALRRAELELSFVVDPARGNAVAIRLGDQDIRKAGERLDLRTEGIGRRELSEARGDEVS